MSNEFDNDNGEEQGTFLDHLFNAFGHVSRAMDQRKAKAAAEAAAKPKRMKKIKISFNEAPAPPPATECCTAKR